MARKIIHLITKAGLGLLEILEIRLGGNEISLRDKFVSVCCSINIRDLILE
jgi:hypothetical protein